MSETKDAVDRLRWLCEEAAARVSEETSLDFTISLEGLQREMEQLVPRLAEAGILKSAEYPPVFLRVDRRLLPDRPSAPEMEMKFLGTMEPLSTYGCVETLLSVNLRYKSSGEFKGYVHKNHQWFGTENVRNSFCLQMRQWVRFLTAESEKLQASLASTAKQPEATPAKPKRAAKAGKGDQTAKIVSWLTKHHEYGDGRAYNYTPAESRDIEDGAGVPPNTVSDFLRKAFPGGEKPRDGYVQACKNKGKLLLWFMIEHKDRLPNSTRGLGNVDPDSEAERF